MAKTFDELCARTMSKASMRRADRRATEILADMFLRELRTTLGLSQKALAAKLGMKQPSLSKLENQRDMQLATLQKIIEALGGQLDVIARFPKGKIRITQFLNHAHVAPYRRTRRLAAA